MLYQRPQCTEIEKPIVEADDVETFTVPDQSKTTSPSPDVVKVPNKKENGRLSARRSTCELVMRLSSLKTRQLDSSNMVQRDGKGH